jgi:hypothetical protein
MSIQHDLYKLINAEQQRFAYYLIALCVTCIGFSVYKTTGEPISSSQIPLGIASLLWSVGIYCGFKYIGYKISTMQANAEMFSVEEGRHEDVGGNVHLKADAHKGIMQAIKTNSSRANMYYRALQILFYLGVVSFLVWHVLEMYLTLIKA